MSLTTRKLTKSLYYLTANGSVSGATTKLSIVFQASTAIYGADSKNGVAIYVDGAKQSPTWTVNKSEDFMGTKKYTKMTSSTLSISKPFFTLKITVDGLELYEEVFSFYEIEKAGNGIRASGGLMNGSTASSVKFDCTSSDAAYKATFKLGSYSNTISSSASLISYAIPISWCNAVTDDITGAASITGQVLFGGKVYKTFTANLTVSVPDTVIPSISSVTFSDVDDSVVPSSWGIYVQGQSGIKLKSISCAGAYGSEIKKVKMTADSRIRATDYPELPEMDHISQSGEVSIMITVTDSRNRTVNKSAVVSIVSYASPKLSSIKSERCNASGETDNDGTYFLSTTSAVFSSCLGKNALTLTVKYKRTDLKNYGNEVQINPGSNVCANNDLDPEYSYDVLYTLSDEFNTVTYSDFVSTAVYLMHFLHGGRGVAFGQKATLADTLDCNFNAVFRKKLSCVLDDGTVLEVRDMMEQIQNNLVNMLCPKGKLPALLLNLLYPIGSIYMSTSSANPTNIMGGIWVSWGEGRVPVGVGTGTDSNNTSVDFSAANQTGGEYTHLLTGAESGQKAVQTGSQSASHTHSLTYNADSGAAASGSDPSGRGAFVRRTASGGATSTWKTGNQSASHTHSISASNASNRHNNIQPYVTCYMWKRTA